jgi:dynein light chain LC8-type
MSDSKVDQPTSQSYDSPNGKDGGPKAIIKNVDMNEEMQQEAVDITSAALEKYNIEKDIAAQIKKEFDRRHGPTWHVVVGKNFGSYVTHGEYCELLLCHQHRSTFISTRRDASTDECFASEVSSELDIELTASSLETKHFIYFYVGPLAVLIWKS